MSVPSLSSGWIRARASSRTIAIGWVGELALLAGGAGVLASDLAAGLAASPAAADVVAARSSAGVYEWMVSLGQHLPMVAGVILGTMLLALVWQTLWQGALAMAWEPSVSTSPGRALGAATGRAGTLFGLALAGGLLEIVSAFVALVVSTPLRAGATPAAWWYAPAYLAVRAAWVAAVWSLAAAAVQHARWEVAGGSGVFRALLRGVRRSLRHPVVNGSALLGWGLWASAWALAWIAFRWLAPLTPSAAILGGLGVLLAVTLALAWGRGVLVLAFAPVDER